MKKTALLLVLCVTLTSAACTAAGTTDTGFDASAAVVTDASVSSATTKPAEKETTTTMVTGTAGGGSSAPAVSGDLPEETSGTSRTTVTARPTTVTTKPKTTKPSTTTKPTEDKYAIKIITGEFITEVLAGIDGQREKFGYPKAVFSEEISAGCVEHAIRMAQAGKIFHATGAECGFMMEGVSYNGAFEEWGLLPARAIGSGMTMHVPDIMSDKYVGIGIVFGYRAEFGSHGYYVCIRSTQDY